MVTIAVVLAALLAGVGAWAFFTGGGQGTALATVATLDPPGSVSTNATSGFTTVTVAWDAATLSNGLAVDGYYTSRTNIASGVTSAACGTSPSALTTNTACSDTSVPNGTYTYAVIAIFRTWTATGAGSAVTVNADTAPPTTTLIFPADNGRYRNSSWTAGCNLAPFNATSTICGTAQDSGANNTAVAQIQVSIQRGSTLKYWDGSGFASSGEVKRTASGTTSWTRAFPAGDFSADGTYTIRAYARDGAGNTSSATSASFLIDNTAPTLTTVVGAATGTSPAGFVKQGGGYRVYANASDAGSGLNAGSLSVDVSAITTGSSAVGLSASGCPCVVGGTSYAYQSAALTANNPLSEGAKAYTLTGADSVGNSGSQSGSVSVDNTAPTLTTVVADSNANAAGFIHQGGSYYIYANASDAGSGLDTSSLAANVNSITTGATALALTTNGGPWTIDGVSYSYRSAQQTAKNPLAPGSVSYTVTGLDMLGNSASPTSSITVDNAAPAPSNVTLANGGTAGTADAGDTVTLVYSEKIASGAFCSTWTNNTISQTLNGTDVVVTITNNGGNDTLTVGGGATCTFHLGSVATSGNYLSATATFAGSGASGTGANSAISWNPSTKALTITLGRQQTGTLNTGVANHTPTYTADSTLKDLAGNSISTTAVNGTNSRF